MDGGMSAKENREERRRWKAEIEEQRRRMDAGKNPMKELERIFIKDIVIGRRLRTINPDRVEELKQSIAAMGLRTPITVRYDYDGDYWRLVAGLHRLEACKALGFEKIRAFILECEDEKTARLWEIAENLHRAELTALERDEHINEWRKLTLEREAANAQVAHLDKPHERGRPNRGHSATAAAFGLSRRDVERAEKVAEDLTTEAKVAARDLHLEDNRSALLKAAKEPTPEAQVQALHDHVEERAQKRATKAAPVTTVETPPVPPPSQADPAAAPEWKSGLDGMVEKISDLVWATLREMAAEDREAYVKKVMQALPLLAPPKEAPAVEGARDIAELDALASEIQVCVTKSNNYVDTARHKIAAVSSALDAGEFGGDWTTRQWLFFKVGLDKVALYLPRPPEAESEADAAKAQRVVAAFRRLPLRARERAMIEIHDKM